MGVVVLFNTKSRVVTENWEAVLKMFQKYGFRLYDLEKGLPDTFEELMAATAEPVA